MQVQDWMTRRVVTVTPETSLLNARRLLATYHIRHLPVVDDGHVVGMISSRDICRGDRTLDAALAALQSGLAEGRFRPVSSLMSTPARTVRPADTIARATERMLDAGIGALAVVDEGRLVGVLSLVDCLRAFLASEREQERRSLQHPCIDDDPDRYQRMPLPGGPWTGRMPAEPAASEPSRAAKAPSQKRKAG
jgi:CBS domain-containing protein